MKILIVDDDKDIVELLSIYVENEGYEVEKAYNGKEALSKLNMNPDIALMILDVMMPQMDGIEVCEQLRSTQGFENTIICLLTARNEDYSQIAGLDAGADDYIAKPVKPKVLLSRLNALLRRSKTVAPLKFENKGIIINREKYLILKDGNEIQLPKKEFELLALLATKPNVVFERNIILEKVWGSDIVVGDRTIDVHVRKLREKIGDDYIKTIKGVGYKFEQI